MSLQWAKYRPGPVDMIGSIISHYRIDSKLGQGGMGEVFQARDTSLGRDVALKFLPEEYASSGDRIARFRREARILASLNHPNIASIHGLEQADSRYFLALELVEGETLAERIARGPLPIEDTLEICRHIAEGLESAHEKGIIHRDLKPANVKITPEGKIKILDFGLARALEDQAPSEDLSLISTIPDDVTVPGMILGTAAYMSPEQAKGKPVDRRADLWSFGCILYECLTGKRPFRGETITEIVASILKSEPDWDALPRGIPAPIRRLLRRCLQKDPNLRLRDIGDARLEMTESPMHSPDEAPVARRFPLSMLAAGASVLVIAGIITGFLITGYFRESPPVPAIYSTIRAEPGNMVGGSQINTRTFLDIAENGRFIVYVGVSEKQTPERVIQIHLRWLDQMNTNPVPGTEGGVWPFLSPDDRWIGFFSDSDRKIKKVPIEGGVPSTLCDIDSGMLLFGMDWGPDDTIVYSVGEGGGLSRISSDGGQPETLTVPDLSRKERAHRLPHFLPDGQSVIFTIVEDAFSIEPRLALLDLKTRKWHELFQNAADGRYVKSGHLVFMRQGTLMAAPFDLDRQEIYGPAAPVIAGVTQALNHPLSTWNSAAGQYSVSVSGRLVYVAGGIYPDAEKTLVHVDQNGNSLPVGEMKGPFGCPRFSPDGGKIAYQTSGRKWQLYAYDLHRDTATRLTSEGRVAYHAWTHDGKLIYGWWSGSENQNLYIQSADGSSPKERLIKSEFAQVPGSLTPDDKILAFLELDPDADRNILLMDMESRQTTPFLNETYWEMFPEISPNGRWIAYVALETGRQEVYVRPLRDQDGRWQLQISKDGGAAPLWSKDGRQLFYRLYNQVWAVDIQTEGGFSPGKPQLLFDKAGFANEEGVMRNWDLWPDGKGFLMVKTEQKEFSPITEIVLVQNWSEELKRLVPNR